MSDDFGPNQLIPGTGAEARFFYVVEHATHPGVAVPMLLPFQPDAAAAAANGWIPVSQTIFEAIGHGQHYVIQNGAVVQADGPPPMPPLTEEMVRDRRDDRLTASDWMVTQDAPVTPSVMEARLAYRQALRDVPLQPGFPANVVWPTLPSGVPPTLEDIKAAAQVQIDIGAEQARLRFLTNGSGQALEYEATRAEAVAILADSSSNLTDEQLAEAYPWIHSEQLALADVGVTKTMREIAQSVVDLTAAWTAAGSTIKRYRRAAKLKVDAAPDEASVNAIVAAIVWPTPPAA